MPVRVLAHEQYRRDILVQHHCLRWMINIFSHFKGTEISIEAEEKKLANLYPAPITVVPKKPREVHCRDGEHRHYPLGSSKSVASRIACIS